MWLLRRHPKSFSTLAMAQETVCSSRRDAGRVLLQIPPSHVRSSIGAVRCLRNTSRTSISGPGTERALGGSCLCLHTTTCSRALSSPPNRASSSVASTAAGDLLSRWSRRTPTSASTAETPLVSEDATEASMAKPTEPKQEDPLADRLSVEELLLFDEGDAAERSVSSQTAKQQIRSTSASTEEHVRGTAPASPKNHSTVRSASPEGSSVSAASAAAASFTLRSEEVNETDDEADVYGIAASAASVERHLMEDLLQQASFNSTNEAENDVEDNEEGGEAAETGNDEALQNIFIHHTNSSYRRGSEPASPHTTSSVNGSDAAPSSNPAVSAEHTNQKDGAAIEDSEGSAPFVTAHVSEAVDVSPSGTDAAEDAVQLAEESNEEDESMDTVLEEETDRMLQAALTNMMKESAANAAVTPTASRPQMSGSGGYVFFSKEAVMAAEELLAASEQSAADAARTSGSQRMGPAAAAAAAAAETNGVEADFDDDAVRAAEMESLGLNMETSKR